MTTPSVLPGPSPTTWYDAILSGLGIDDNGYNSEALRAWHTTEGVPLHIFNWMAAEDRIPGSYNYNSAGVQVYPSFGEGVGVYIRKFNSSLYAAIRHQLRYGDLYDIWLAINQSSWCRGCQAGKYPNVLWGLIQHPGIPSTVPDLATLLAAPQQTGPSPAAWDEHVDRAGSHFRALAGLHGRSGDRIRNLTWSV